MYGFKIWSLTLKKEQRVRVFENRVLRRMFGAVGAEVTRGEGNCITWILIICTSTEHN
jgi:hypothetical protein